MLHDFLVCPCGSHTVIHLFQSTQRTWNVIFHQQSPHVVILFAQEYMLSYVQTASKLDSLLHPPNISPRQAIPAINLKLHLCVKPQPNCLRGCCGNIVVPHRAAGVGWCILEETSMTIDCIYCNRFTKLLKFSLILFDLNKMQLSRILASFLSAFRGDSANYPLASCLFTNVSSAPEHVFLAPQPEHTEKCMVMIRLYQATSITKGVAQPWSWLQIPSALVWPCSYPLLMRHSLFSPRTAGVSPLSSSRGGGSCTVKTCPQMAHLHLMLQCLCCSARKGLLHSEFGPVLLEEGAIQETWC